MVQLSFLAEDIKRNKSYFLRFFIQVTCTLILLGICVTQLVSTNEFRKKFAIFQETSEMYILRDCTEETLINERLSEPSIQGKVYEFYRFLCDSDEFSFYSYCRGQLPAEKDDLDIEYIEFPDQSRYYPMMLVDQNFWTLFSLSCASGRAFTETDFTTESSQIPIILGAGYSDVYAVGDVIDGTYAVVGILEEKAFYLSPGTCGDVLYLKDTVLVPLVIHEQTDFTRIEQTITSGTVVTKDTRCLSSIANKAKSIELYEEMEFISFADQLQRIVRDNMFAVYLMMTIQFMLLFFCVVCMISALLNFVESHKKEFAIHILCGAKHSDLSLRIALQVGSCLLVSDILSLVIFGLSVSMVAVLLASILIGVLVVSFPIAKIAKKPLIDFLIEV